VPKEVCGRIGTPNSVDGNAWKYVSALKNSDPGDLIVEFEAGTVRALDSTPSGIAVRRQV